MDAQTPDNNTGANEHIVAESKALRTLEHKLSIATNSLSELQRDQDAIKLETEHPLLRIPKIDRGKMQKAAQQEEKRKERAEMRGDLYEMMPCNVEALSQPARIREIERQNELLDDQNSEIRRKNAEKKRQIQIITTRMRAIDADIAKLTLYIKEAQKNLRYLDYALKWGIPFTLKNLIKICNKHRNLYIAHSRYAECTASIEPQGFYSKCAKGALFCDEKMKYVAYDHAVCSCGASSWTLSDPDKWFDISDTSAEGEGYGWSMFGANISSEYENNEKIGRLVRKELFGIQEDEDEDEDEGDEDEDEEDGEDEEDEDGEEDDCL